VIDELTTALKDYQAKWQAFVGERSDKTFFENLKPTSVAWKTEDLEDYDARLNELRDLSGEIFIKWMNDRWIAKICLREPLLPWNLRIIKLMQRRPNSTDAVGLDHVDFYTAQKVEPILQKESNIKWNYEKNNAEWYSVWFAAGEAKLRNDTICRVCADEMLDVEKEILK
jgi:hypothetical protein